jgi:hypothetical protein
MWQHELAIIIGTKHPTHESNNCTACAPASICAFRYFTSARAISDIIACQAPLSSYINRFVWT